MGLELLALLLGDTVAKQHAIHPSEVCIRRYTICLLNACEQILLRDNNTMLVTIAVIMCVYNVPGESTFPKLSPSAPPRNTERWVLLSPLDRESGNTES